MKRNIMMKRQRISPGLLYKIIICIMCTCQSIAALVLSMAPAKILDNNAHPNLALLLLGALILFLLLAAIAFFLKNPIVIIFICTFILNLIALINYYEIKLHGTVLTHQDIRNISTAFRHIGSYDIELSKEVMWMILLFLALLFVFAVLYTQGIKFERNIKAGILSTGLMIFLVYIFVFSPIPVIKSETWSWERKYYTDGYVIGTLENLKSAFHIAIKPDGYEDIMSELNAAEMDRSALLNSDSDSYPDIIMILNETYYDMGIFRNFSPDISYMKNYEALNAYKGYAVVPYTGGGTNASEYELLTCNSMTLINSSSPFNDLHFSDSPSLVNYLDNLGYATMAAHPFIPGNYHRKIVWEELGFDNSYFLSDFSELDYYGNRSYCTDSSAFNNFIKFYEQMPEESPRFAYLLTIQNHGEWNSNETDSDIVHIEKDFGLSDPDREKMNEYLSCIKLTDDFIDEMIEYFSNNGRDVVIYMVGDHCPSFLNEPVFDDQGENNTDTSLEKTKVINLEKRKVPYFIWSSNQENLLKMPENAEIDLCALSAYAVKAAGLPLSCYYDQLLRLSAGTPCITGVETGAEDSVIGFVQNSGEVESIYSGSNTANEVKKYFCMEYNSLQRSASNKWLFLPYSYNEEIKESE